MTPLRTNVNRSFTIFYAYRPIGSTMEGHVFRPFSFVSVHVYKIISASGNRNSSGFFNVINTRVTISLFSIYCSSFPKEMITSPLRRVSIFPRSILHLFGSIRGSYGIYKLHLSSFCRDFLFCLYNVFL